MRKTKRYASIAAVLEDYDTVEEAMFGRGKKRPENPLTIMSNKINKRRKKSKKS